MKCFACQSDNREGVKFCEECGTRIALVCPRCDHQIPVGKKFCGECGQRLALDDAAPADPVIDYDRPDSYTPKFMAEKILTTRGSLEGERKLVTVFFLRCHRIYRPFRNAGSGSGASDHGRLL